MNDLNRFQKFIQESSVMQISWEDNSKFYRQDLYMWIQHWLLDDFMEIFGSYFDFENTVEVALLSDAVFINLSDMFGDDFDLEEIFPKEATK